MRKTWRYDSYLWVQRLDATQGNAVRTEFVWDPTEPVATRPLAMRAKNWGLNLFYTHDGNKNVSEVFYHAPQNGIAAHYDYAPFGAVSRTSRATRVTNRDLLSENPFRFSSEVHDAPLDLVYYNYRHYNPKDGRWLGRDPMEEDTIVNIYLALRNNPSLYDLLGMVLPTLGGPSAVTDVLIYEPNTQTQPFPTTLPKPSPLDHINFGERSDNFNYTQWLKIRFPKTMEGATTLLIQRMNDSVCKARESFPTAIPDLVDEENDVDVDASMSRFGDRAENFWERYAMIGNFEIRAKNISINWIDDCCYKYTMTIFVWEHFGRTTDSGSNFSDLLLWPVGFMTKPREASLGEWQVSGENCCEN